MYFYNNVAKYIIVHSKSIMKLNFGLVVFFIMLFIFIIEFVKYVYDVNMLNKTSIFSIFDYKEEEQEEQEEQFDRMLRTDIENFDSMVQTQTPLIDNSNVPDVKFPFKNARDNNGNKLNVIMISAPFRTQEDENTYNELKKQNMKFCGISSYLDFPDKIVNPFEDRFHEERKHNYISMVDSWLYCFRPEKMPKKLSNSKLPMMLITEADLKDTDGYYKPDPTIEKEYDFMYICLDDDESPDPKCVPGWQWYNRNWDLAKKCLEVMCHDYNLKGIIVGRTNCEFTNKCNGIVKTVPFMDFHTFQKEMKKCKWLFVPNISDASPRVMTEALCYNMPVLTNYDIIGGWHNVIPGVTGEFFTNETDIVPALDNLTQNYDKYKAREWYCNNRGRNIYGKKLAEFLKKNYPTLNNPNIEWADI